MFYPLFLCFVELPYVLRQIPNPGENLCNVRESSWMDIELLLIADSLRLSTNLVVSKFTIHQMALSSLVTDDLKC